MPSSETGKRLYILLVLFCLFSIDYAAAQSSRQYVRIIVEDVVTSQEANAVDSLIRLQNGVLTSRMDRRTSVYFGVFETTSGLTPTDFIAWIESLGFSPSCFVQGNHGTGEPMISLNRSDCDPADQLETR